MAVMTVTAVVILAALLFSWAQSDDGEEDRPIEDVGGSWSLVLSCSESGIPFETGDIDITVDGQELTVRTEGFDFDETFLIVSPYEAVNTRAGFSSQLYIENGSLFLITVIDIYGLESERTSISYGLYDRSGQSEFPGDEIVLECSSFTMDLMSMSLDPVMGDGPVETTSVEVVIDSTDLHIVHGRIVSDDGEVGFRGFPKTDGRDVNIVFTLDGEMGEGAFVIHRDGSVDLSYHGDYFLLWGSTGDIADSMGVCGKHEVGRVGTETTTMYISSEGGLYVISSDRMGYTGVEIPMLGGEYVLSMFRSFGSLGVLVWNASDPDSLYLAGVMLA